MTSVFNTLGRKKVTPATQTKKFQQCGSTQILHRLPTTYLVDSTTFPKISSTNISGNLVDTSTFLADSTAFPEISSTRQNSRRFENTSGNIDKRQHFSSTRQHFRKTCPLDNISRQLDNMSGNLVDSSAQHPTTFLVDATNFRGNLVDLTTFLVDSTTFLEISSTRQRFSSTRQHSVTNEQTIQPSCTGRLRGRVSAGRQSTLAHASFKLIAQASLTREACLEHACLRWQRSLSLSCHSKWSPPSQHDLLAE